MQFTQTKCISESTWRATSTPINVLIGLFAIILAMREPTMLPIAYIK